MSAKTVTITTGLVLNRKLHLDLGGRLRPASCAGKRYGSPVVKVTRTIEGAASYEPADWRAYLNREDEATKANIADLAEQITPEIRANLCEKCAPYAWRAAASAEIGG